MNNYETKLLIMRKITFNNTLKPALLVLMLVFGLTSWGQTTYTLVKNVSQLQNGSKIIMVGVKNPGPSAQYYVLNDQDSNNRKTTLISTGAMSGDNITLSSAYSELELKATGANWEIFDANYSAPTGGYLYAAGANSSNYLRTQTTNTTNGVWSISIAGVTFQASIIAQGTATRRNLKFNSLNSPTLFSCYADVNSQDPVFIYVAPDGVPEITLEDDQYSGIVGQSFSLPITTTNPATSYTLTGTLPVGLSFSSGVISGTPTTAGTSLCTGPGVECYFSITATNSMGTGDPYYFKIVIAKGNQTITDFVPQTFYNNDPPFTLPTHTDQGLPITYSIDSQTPAGVVAVSGNTFTLNPLVSGTAIIRATQPGGNSNWNNYTSTITLTVVDPPLLSAVISQVYGGGGNASSPYKKDFVELYNPRNVSISLDGMYIQYASATGNFAEYDVDNDTYTGEYLSLTGHQMPPKSYFLIELSGAVIPPAGSEDLPTPDMAGSINLNATAGKVALTSNLILEHGGYTNPVTNPQYIIDLVGYGTTASLYEGDNRAPAPSNTKAVIRKEEGEQDTNNNGTDFQALTPTPRNSKHGIAIWQSGAWTKTPAIDKNVIIRDVLVIDGSITAKESFEAKSLILDATVDGNNAPVYNASLTIKDTYHIKVDKNIASNGNFIVENGANLVQINDDAVNTGNITVKVNSNPMKRLEWTLWSSPVAGQNLFTFSPQTVTSRIYKYNPSTDEYDNTGINASSVFEKGIGFLFRAPNNYSPTTAQVFEGKFTGVPHNGVVNVSVVPSAFNGLGNPYPSAIDTEEFFDANPGVHTIYFWENVPLTPEGDAYAGPTYVTNTAAGGTIPTALERIAVGQGFIAWIESGTQVTFNNSIRETQKGMFFKTMNNEKHRLWLNLSKTEGNSVNNILVAYMEGASNGFDAQIDGEFFGYEGTALYNIVENSEAVYAVQGRSLPFTDTDIVPLGFRATQSGSYTISLANFDGLFTDGQDIYLKDNDTEIIHDLKDTAYTFVSEEGVFNDRFEVVYKTTGDLNVNNPEHNNKWVVYSKGNGFQIEAQGFEMKEVMVYDMLGRMVYNSSAEGTSHTIANITNGVLIVKVITADNQTLIRKTAK